MRRDWTESENTAVCLAYCIMLAAQKRGEKFNKSAIRRELIGTEAEQGPLYNRSNGSIEAKLMNCSAVAVSLGWPLLKGYKPAPNYQKCLRWHMTEALALVEDDTAHGIATSIDVAVA
jgi:hypothetical protein